MEDLDREVLPLLTEHLPTFLLEDLARAVMGVDDVVAALELDVLEDGDLEVLDERRVGGVRNGAPPWVSPAAPPRAWGS